jgi:HK97 family phage major capsid protein
MKRINELKELRAQKIEALKAITAQAEQEKRYKSNEELTSWNNLKSEVEEIDQELQTLEFEERQNINIVKNTIQKEVETKEEKELKRYNLSKAINEFSKGKLEGFEKEMHEEGENEYKRFGQSANGLIIPSAVMRSFTKAGNGSHISEIAQGYDVIADRNLLNQLGVTVYDNLTANMKLTFSDGFSAGFYNEGATVADGTVNEATDKLEARRVQGSGSYSKEFLAQSSTMPQLMQDMVGSIETAVAKEVIDQILALAALAGYDPAVDAAKVLTWKDVMKLKAAVKTPQLVRPKFVAGGDLYSSLEATAKDAGSGRFIVDGGKIGAYEAVDMQGIVPLIADTALDADADPTHALIFGDMSRAYVGYFGSGIELLVDPYTNAAKGEIKVVYSRLGDVALNPKAFKAIKNALV